MLRISPCFKTQQQGQGLQAEVASINKVPEEYVVLIARNAGVAFFKRS